jgi:DNA-binding transcriptional LysR family regulator
MDLDLVRLRSFLEVAERGTVAAASQALGYTPPAVSQHLAKLERDLGTLLFDRVGGHLHLAPPGEALVPIARDLLELASVAADVVHAPPPHPHVTVAGFASAISALLLPHLARIADLASLDIVEAEDAAAVRELRLGHVDVALIQEYPGDRTERDPKLTYTELVSDELRLVLPPSFPATTAIADLGDVPWLINGTGTRCAAATHQILRDARIDPRVNGNISDNDALLALVAAGHGVTIVPDLVLADVGRAVTIARQTLGVSRTLLAVSRRTPTAGVTAVLEAITTEIR